VSRLTIESGHSRGTLWRLTGLFIYAKPVRLTRHFHNVFLSVSAAKHVKNGASFKMPYSTKRYKKDIVGQNETSFYACFLRFLCFFGQRYIRKISGYCLM
jgi:hypothetical protein